MQTYYGSNESVASSALPSPWLIGKKEDITFFSLPVFIALLIFGMAQHPAVTNSVFLTMIAGYGFGLGPLHQGPSWFTYFDKDNFAYYSSNRLNQLRFFVMPPCLIVIGIAATIICPLFLFGALTICHVDHLLQQTVRLARLYRQEGTFATCSPIMEGLSQYSVAAAFTMIGFFRFNFLNFATMPGAGLLTTVTCMLAFVSVVIYLTGIIGEHKKGLPLHVPALLFWTISVLAWVPAAFVTNFFNAFLLPLTIHWFQFIGFNSVLVERKAKADRSSHPESTKPAFPPAATLLTMSFTYMALFIAIDWACHSNMAVLMKVIGLGILAGLSMCHYMLDTFIWRFQDEYPKKNIVPYICSSR